MVYNSRMFVCICLGVTESEIAAAIDEGHATVRAINRKLGAAGCCGACVPSIEAIIDLHKEHELLAEPLLHAAG